MREEILSMPKMNGLVSFASKDKNGITVFLINKREEAVEITISPPENAGLEGVQSSTYEYSGTRPEDLYPSFKETAAYQWGETRVLKPVSLTIFDWKI